MKRLTLYARPTWMLRSGIFLMMIVAGAATVSCLLARHEGEQSLRLRDYVRMLDRVQISMLQMETGQQGYLITGETPSLASYDRGLGPLAATLNEIARFDTGAVGLSAPKRPIAEMVAEKKADLDHAIALRRDVGQAAATQVSEAAAGVRLMTALRDVLSGQRERANLLEARHEQMTLIEDGMTVALIVGGLLLSGGLAVISLTLLRYEISAHQAVEIALRERQVALTRSNDELEQFAHIASHDLQEPLRMISSYIQLLHRRYAGKLDADADEFISYAVNGAKRMQALINDLLNFSRVGSQGTPPEPVDMELALGDTLKDLEIRIEDCGATVTHDRLPMVSADPVQMRQLLLNLISNGMKFQPPKQKPRVRISVVREGPEWRIGVHDNGIGIEAPYLQNLFQIFKRLHSLDEYPGTGIGLAVCKKIVERHGGHISVQSVFGHGSTFLFTLPVMEPVL